jgi:hypothetical protein
MARRSAMNSLSGMQSIHYKKEISSAVPPPASCLPFDCIASLLARITLSDGRFIGLKEFAFLSGDPSP